MRKALIILLLVVFSCDREFKTIFISTLEITEISTTSIQCGGKLTGNTTDITTKGVCWSTLENPTIDDHKTENGSGDGDFTSVISGLEEKTTYYIRAYAINNEATLYGDARSYTTGCEGEIYLGDLTLTTQEQINDFGANCYNRVTGYLTIGDETPSETILNLDPLINLTQIDGRLTIRHNKILETLEGLNNLTSVNILVINDNNLLNSIEGLNNLTSITRALYISYNSNLTNLDGLSQITSVGSSGGGWNSLSISNNKNLINLHGLSQITTVYGNLMIKENNALTSLYGLHNIISVGGEDVIIAENEILTDLCAIRPLLINPGGFDGNYTIQNNAFNPTIEDIIDGNCNE